MTGVNYCAIYIVAIFSNHAYTCTLVFIKCTCAPVAYLQVWGFKCPLFCVPGGYLRFYLLTLLDHEQIKTYVDVAIDSVSCHIVDSLQIHHLK